MKTTESSLSQPLRRGRGHPRKKRSDAPTNAPEVPPPPVPPAESNGSLPERVLMSTNVPELIPQISVPPLGSTSAMPFLIPCDEKEELRETKLKLTPLSRLIEEKETHASTNGSSFQMHEESKKVFTDQVKSMLVSQLTSGTTTSVDDMVTFANRAFTTLNLFGADYGPLYKDVKDFITYNFDLLIADRKLDLLSVSELEKKLGAVIRGNDIKDEKCLKDDEQKYRAAYRIAQAEVEKLGTQLKAARVAQMEIEQRKNEALQGIESSTQRLMSYK